MAALTIALFASGVAPAARVDAGSSPAVGIVGDSISFEALEEVPEIIPPERPVAFHLTELGIELRDIQTRTLNALRAPGAPDIVVLVIGTSQAQHDPPHRWRTDLRAFLNQAVPLVDCVRVFDIQEREAFYYQQLARWAPTYNRITRDIVDDYAKVEYFHYSAWVDRTGPEYDAGDSLHHNRAGERAVARLIRDVAAGCDPAVSSGPFWDVRDSFWAAEAIAWLGTSGLATGYDNRTYRAVIGEYKVNVARGQYTAMLWRMAGSPTGYGPHPWSDGEPWLDEALRWAWATGVATGFGDQTFRPDATITRGQATQQLWRLGGERDVATDHGWPDGAPWLDPTLDWLTEYDLMSGFPNGTFGPSALLTRAQIARLLFRFDQLPQAAETHEEPTTTTGPAPPTTAAAPTTTTPPATAPPSTTPSTTAPTIPGPTTPGPTTTPASTTTPGPAPQT